MMTNDYVRKLSVPVITITAIIAMAITAFLPRAYAAGETTPHQYELFSFRDPETGELNKVHAQDTPASEVRQYSPAHLRNQPSPFNKACSKGLKDFFIHDYPIETVAFNTALALSASHQMAGDPAAYRHFFEHSVLSPEGHAAFLGFMIANRGFVKAMQMLGFAFDPCNIKHLQKGITLKQRLFGPLIGPLGMSVGMVASNVVHELLADENLHQCAAGLYKTVDAGKRAEACETAYEDWAVSHKINQYAPDILSGVAASLIQGYLVNQGAKKALEKVGQSKIARQIVKSGAERVIPVALRSARLAWSVGRFGGGPYIQFAMTVANIAIFLDIQERITPYIKPAWETNRQGKDITSRIDQIEEELARLEKNNWVWTSNPKAETCTQNAPGLAYGECKESPRPGHLLKKLEQKQSSWRTFILQDATETHANWKNYVLKFQNMYNAAHSFYGDITDNINEFRTDGRAAGKRPVRLFQSEPFNGIDPASDVEPQQGESGSQFLDRYHAQQELTIAKARSVLIALIKEREEGRATPLMRDELDKLRSILDGFEAMDMNKPYLQTKFVLQMMRAKSNMLRTHGETIDANEEARVDLELRRSRFAEAMNLVNRALRDPGSVYSDYGTPIDHPSYREIAQRNPFAALRMVLGDPNPLPEGQAYVLGIESDNDMINQEMKTMHPSSIYLAQTPRMTDYLLASMVCGPEATPSLEIKVAYYNRNTYSANGASFADRVLGFLGMDKPFRPVLGQRATPDELLSVERFFNNSEVTPAPTVLGNGGDYNMAPRYWSSSVEFRPPRVVNFPVSYNLCGKNIATMPEFQANPNPFDVYKRPFRLQGREYKGFLDIVKKFVREDIIGRSREEYKEGGFPVWWTKNVDTHVKRVVDVFRQDFDALMKQKFIPALTRTDMEMFGQHQFPLGAGRSVIEDARYHALLIRRIYLSTAQSPDKAAIDETIQALMKRYKLAVALFGEPRQMQWAVYEIETGMSWKEWNARNLPLPDFTGLETRIGKRALDAFEKNQKELKKILEKLGASTGCQSLFANAAEQKTETQSSPSVVFRKEITPGAQQTVKEIRDAAFANLNALVTETDSFFSIVNTLRFDGVE